MVSKLVKEKKVERVEEIKKLIGSSPVVGIIDMHKTPTKQLQQIRKGLRSKAVIKMAKKTILKYAFEGLKDEKMKQIENYIPTQPAIILTDMEPFKFYILVKNLKFKTFAKKGDVSKEDIWVSSGPTSLMAGPAISELQQVGLPASVESGRIAIRKDTLFVKTGEEIDIKKAGVLRKLNIEPIDVTLNIVAIYDKGLVYAKDLLDTALVYPSMLPQAFEKALNLSVHVCFPTKESIKYLLSKAVRAAGGLNSVVNKSVQVSGEQSLGKTDEGGESAKSDNTQAAQQKVQNDVQKNVKQDVQQSGGAS
jgi:large subunit ribosomal protein L10